MAEWIELCWEWLEMLGLNRQKPERAALLESIETPAGITSTLDSRAVASAGSVPRTRIREEPPDVGSRSRGADVHMCRWADGTW